MPPRVVLTSGFGERRIGEVTLGFSTRPSDSEPALCGRTDAVQHSTRIDVVAYSVSDVPIPAVSGPVIHCD